MKLTLEQMFHSRSKWKFNHEEFKWNRLYRNPIWKLRMSLVWLMLLLFHESVVIERGFSIWHSGKRIYLLFSEYEHIQRLYQISHKVSEWQGKWLKKSDEKKRSKIGCSGIVLEKQSIDLNLCFLGSAKWVTVILSINFQRWKHYLELYP